MKFPTMPNATNASILIAVVALGVGLGFGLARHDSGDASSFCDRLAPLGPDAMEAAVREALLLKETLPRVSRLVRLMEILDESNVAGAAKVFDEKITSLDKEDLRIFVGAWASFDPEAAMNGVLAWRLPSMRRFGAGVVVHDWAASGSPMRALERLREVKEWKTRDPAYGELVNGWVRYGDIEGVTKFVSKLPNSDGRDILLASMMEGILLEHGVDGIIRWAEAVPVDAADKFKKTAFRKALRQVSNRDPVRAAAWYEELEHEEYATIMMAVVATEWAEVDPEAAIAWVRARPAGEAKDLAYQRLMIRWVGIDRIAATDWMEQADLDSEYQFLLDPFIRATAATHPDQAVRWIDRVQDPQARERLIVVVATTWRKRDPDRAEAWLEKLDLSEEIRARIARTAPGLPTDQRLVIPEEAEQ
jgi:hypothetical protein